MSATDLRQALRLDGATAAGVNIYTIACGEVLTRPFDQMRCWEERLNQKMTRRHFARLGAALAVALSAAISVQPAAAFSEKQEQEIWNALDPDHHGKVTRDQFEGTKMNAFFYRRRPDASGEMKPVTFEETGFSREFFDKADTDHDGTLDAIEAIDAIKFEDIDTAGRGYFDFDDLVIFLKKIGR